MSTLTVPKPMLGEVTAITITSADLEKSLDFYKRLGFTVVLQGDIPFPWIQISDGALLIMLRKDAGSYISLTYYVKEMDRVVAEVEAAGIKFIEKKQFEFIQRNIITSPDNIKISLVTHVDGFNQPKGPTMLSMEQSDYFSPDKYVNKVCGMFGEYAHPVADLEQSILFWEKLGFTALSTFTSPYPWAIISDGLAVVGLHQTTGFSYPVITYFAADMKDKIEKLKSEGITDFAERGAGNIVINTPEGQHVNLFKLGM